MKKTTLLAAILLGLLFGCKDNSNPETTEKESIETTHTHTVSAEYDDWRDKIQLDTDNVKWKANPETNEGIARMMESIEKSNPTNIEDYHQLARDLDRTKNYILRECTMVGASHENLHIFLHPLIQEIAALEGVSSLEEGQQITNSIENNLQAYEEYFE